MDCLTFDATKVNFLLLGVILDNPDAQKAVYHEKMGICTFPNGTSDWRRLVKIHAHTRLLRSLASKHVDGRRLSYFGGSFQDLLATVVESLDLDNHVTIAHANVANFDTQLITRKDHPDEGDVVARENMLRMAYEKDTSHLRKDSIWVALSDYILDIATRGSAGPQSMRNSAGQCCIIREVGVDVDGVEVAGDF